MTNFERAMVRHIARTAYTSVVQRYGAARAETAARERTNAFIADLEDDTLQAQLRRDLDEFLDEQRNTR